MDTSSYDFHVYMRPHREESSKFYSQKKNDSVTKNVREICNAYPMLKTSLPKSSGFAIGLHKTKKKNNKLRSLSQRANNVDRATSACRRR
jgi:hypothetical protein